MLFLFRIVARESYRGSGIEPFPQQDLLVELGYRSQRPETNGDSKIWRQ